MFSRVLGQNLKIAASTILTSNKPTADDRWTREFAIAGSQTVQGFVYEEEELNIYIYIYNCDRKPVQGSKRYRKNVFINYKVRLMIIMIEPFGSTAAHKQMLWDPTGITALDSVSTPQSGLTLVLTCRVDSSSQPTRPRDELSCLCSWRLFLVLAEQRKQARTTTHRIKRQPGFSTEYVSIIRCSLWLKKSPDHLFSRGWITILQPIIRMEDNSIIWEVHTFL